MKLAEFAINRPITIVMVTLSMLVLGWISLTRLPLESFPSISSTAVNVNVSYPSSSPEEIEREITRPIEESVAMLSNIERISATSSQSNSSVRVEFVAGTDMEMANMEVRERVEQVKGELPDDIGRIRIRRWQSNDREALDANMAWSGEGDRLFDIYRKVVEPRLLRIDGVANVTVDGIDQKQLIVELDQQRLESHDVSFPFLNRQLRDNNVTTSLGRIDDGGRRHQVRALGEFETPEQMAELPLPGTGLELQDLGLVSYEYPEKTYYRRLNGEIAVSVEVFKSSTANLVEMAEEVRETLKEIEGLYDGKLDIQIIRDRSQDVLREVDNLTDAAFLGMTLAIGIIFVFLRNIRSTLVIGVSIPVSVMCVFVGLYVARTFFGSTVTLNMVSMTGLMLAVGMLVDPAVVTLESIFRKRQEEGVEPREAALSGSREIGMAVVASSLTTMCVFVPFFFLSSSRMTTWMRDAGLAICLAVAVSTVVSLAVIPLASSRLYRSRFDRYDGMLKLIVILGLAAAGCWIAYGLGLQGMATWASNWSARVWGTIVGMEWTTGLGLTLTLVVVAAVALPVKRRGMRTAYVSLLSWTLRHRFWTLLVTVALLGSGIYLFMQIEQRGTPRTPERRVDISVETDRSLTLDEVKAEFELMEQVVLERKSELDVESVSTRFGQRGGRLIVRLVDADEGHRETADVGKSIMTLLPQKPGVRYKMGRRRSWMGSMLGVEVQLKGPDESVLAVLAEEIQLELAKLPGVKDVDTSLEDGDEEILVSVDREQALEYGLSPANVASTIATALGTRRTTTFKADDREIDVVLQLEEEDRVDLEQLQNSRFEGRDDTRIQLAAVASFSFEEGPRNVQREDRQHTATVFANTENRMQAFQLSSQIRTMMGTADLPPGYTWDLGRAARWMQQDTQENNFTLIFALLLIYLIMASLFESLIHPFTIMLAIPFSLIGVSAGLYAFDIPLDNNGILGLLILFGIVVNNGIVLIDHINHFRRDGLPRTEAILKGGQNRLRPILMTASTTVLNLMPLVLPMIYGTAEGFARRWGPVGLVVVSGLTCSTILTLVLAPTLYSLLDDLGLWIRRVISASRTATHQGHQS